MKIMIEAYDSSAPSWIKHLLNSEMPGGRTFRGRTIADRTLDFDAGTAKFIDLSDSGESVNQIRNRLKKQGAIIFCRMFNDNALIIRPDATNKTNGLHISGDLAYRYKDKSFKYIIENAAEVWYTDSTTVRKDKIADRQKSRDGVISRKSDSAQDSNMHRAWDDTAKWEEDASGYVYDANRLSKKLANMHENDASYLLKKSASTFEAMVDLYSDTIKKLVRTGAPYDTGTFSNTGISRISRDGQRKLEDTAQSINYLQQEVNYFLMSIDEVNAKREEPMSQEDYAASRERLLRRSKDYYAEIQSNYISMKKICAGQDD